MASAQQQPDEPVFQCDPALLRAAGIPEGRVLTAEQVSEGQNVCCGVVLCCVVLCAGRWLRESTLTQGSTASPVICDMCALAVICLLLQFRLLRHAIPANPRQEASLVM